MHKGKFMALPNIAVNSGNRVYGFGLNQSWWSVKGNLLSKCLSSTVKGLVLSVKTRIMILASSFLLYL